MSSLNQGYFFTTFPARAVEDENLSHAEIRVLLALCTFINKTNQCWPSYSTLAERCKMDKRNVLKYVKNLETHGYITITPRISKEKGHGSNIYSIIWDNGERISTDKIPDEEFEDQEPSPSGNFYHPPSGNHYHQASGNGYHPNNTNITKPKEERERVVNRDAIHPSQTQTAEVLLGDWNNFSHTVGLSSVLKLTPQRKSILLARFRDLDNSLINWAQYLQKISQTPFLLGQNDRGWRLTFDKAINETMFCKILEGNFDSKKHSGIEELYNLADQMDRQADQERGTCDANI